MLVCLNNESPAYKEPYDSPKEGNLKSCWIQHKVRNCKECKQIGDNHTGEMKDWEAN